MESGGCKSKRGCVQEGCGVRPERVWCPSVKKRGCPGRVGAVSPEDRVSMEGEGL